MHWADVIAYRFDRDVEQVIATGITPSGPIHIGNMREVLTADAVYRAAKDLGIKARFIYIADDFDPLRKVYPFLPDHYEKYIGMPLSEIPCPCGGHRSYADHYLSSFLQSLKELGIKPEVYRASEMYIKGEYRDLICISLENSGRIKKIMEEVSGRALPKDWLPFNIKCENCGRLTSSKALLYEYPMIEYECDCGYQGEIDIRKGGVGKLPWRVDWPARWKLFGVTFEPFGKDHAAAGGSWDTGKRISKEIFNYPPPMHVVYEFIQLKGKGAMHSSKGTAVSAEEMLRMTPPEVLRFLIMKNKPSKHIDFDPGIGILDLVDEYDKEERMYFGEEEAERGIKDLKRTYELSQPYEIPDKLPIQVPYRHLVTVVQITRKWEEIKKILIRNGQIPEELDKRDEERLKKRVENVLYWLDRFAPEKVKFEVKKELPKVSITKDQLNALKVLENILANIEWTPENLHDAIYKCAEKSGTNAKDIFSAVYLIILGQKHGPRLGYFLALLGKDFVMNRLREAIKYSAS
ncbi:MAG: lysine--tRNA ligase [Thermoplasmata archaeon]|nr:MAG: lysine--tRNA ligase [Thermoplasmata archaeon]